MSLPPKTTPSTYLENASYQRWRCLSVLKIWNGELSLGYEFSPEVYQKVLAEILEGKQTRRS